MAIVHTVAVFIGLDMPVAEESYQAESVMDWSGSAEVDDETGLIRNVALCGNYSSNGYEIPPEAFGSESRVKELYDGRHIFWSNHPDRLETAHTRPVEMMAGYVINPRMVGGRPRGDIHTEGLPHGKRLRDLAKSKIPHVGLSHIAAYTFNSSKTRIESIDQVLALDVVAHPATTRSFSEQSKTVPPMSDANEKLAAKYEAEAKQVRAEFDAYRDKAKEEISALQGEQDKAKAELEKVTAERDKLVAEVDKFNAEQALVQRRKSISSLFEKHELDEKDSKLCSEAFIGVLMRTDDEAERENLVKDRAEVFSSVVKGESGSVVRSKERSTAPASGMSDIDSLLKSGKLMRSN